MEYKQILYNDFSKFLKEEFIEYCEKYNKKTSGINDVITFLLDKQLIKISQVRAYTILSDFEATKKQQISKTKIVSILAKKYNVSERTIWTLIKSS